jgi:hypothetical protein
MAELTYGRLDEMLRAMGFSAHVLEEKARVYLEEQTGALIALPLFPQDKEVLPRHLLAVRSILDAYGMADPTEDPAKRQKAS